MMTTRRSDAGDRLYVSESSLETVTPELMLELGLGLCAGHIEQARGIIERRRARAPLLEVLAHARTAARWLEAAAEARASGDITSRLR